MASDMFVVFGTGGKGVKVEGETLDATFAAKKGIEISSFSWGVSNPTIVGTGGGLGAGKASFSSVNFMKYADVATAALLTSVASGEHFDVVTLHCRRAGGDAQEYLVITLNEVLVESVQHSASDGGGIATESVSLAFGKVKTEYFAQSQKGEKAAAAKTFTWDVTKNAKS
jgi:type VI secretion system secreted protein Hcp